MSYICLKSWQSHGKIDITMCDRPLLTSATPFHSSAFPKNLVVFVFTQHLCSYSLTLEAFFRFMTMQSQKNESQKMEMAPVAMEAAWMFHLRPLISANARQSSAGNLQLLKFTAASLEPAQLSNGYVCVFFHEHHRGIDTRPPESNLKKKASITRKATCECAV